MAYFAVEELSGEERVQQIGVELLELLDKAADTKRLLLDLKGVRFMSSAMIGKLVLLTKKAKSGGIELNFCNISPNVLEVFQITGLNKVFRIINDDAREDWKDDEDDNDDNNDSGNAGIFAFLPKFPGSDGASAKPPKDK